MYILRLRKRIVHTKTIHKLFHLDPLRLEHFQIDAVSIRLNAERRPKGIKMFQTKTH